MKYLYNENYKSLTKEIKGDLKKKAYHGQEQEEGRLITVKVAIMLKLIYKLKAIPTKIITAYFAEIEKPIPQTHMEVHRAPNGQNNLKKEQSLWTHIS